MRYTGYDTLYDYIQRLDIPDGNHTLILEANGENVEIDIEMYNFYSDVTYSEIDSLGNDIPDTRMLVLRYHKSLTISEGAVFRPKVRKKGMLVWVNDILTNNGTISMTARGAIATGQNVYLYKNQDGTFEYVSAVGGLGGVSAASKGMDGTGRNLGGGGAGASGGTSPPPFGRGGNATSYSGGTGGGGVYRDGSGGTGTAAMPGSDIGGAGGDGSGNRYNTYGSGGAGNPPGRDGNTNLGGAGINSAQSGSGGLLIIYAKTMLNNHLIESIGSDVNSRKPSGIDRYSGGGASGGGSVNIFIQDEITVGYINVSGGTSNLNHSFTYGKAGGAGGNGTVTITSGLKINNIQIDNLSISKTNPWYQDRYIYINADVNERLNRQIQYKVLVNDIETIPLSQLQPTPAELNIQVPTDNFVVGNNLLELIVIDELGLEAYFSYIIRKENRDTFIFTRVFDFKEDYITDENIEVIYGRGLTLKEIGTGEVNIEIPTEGKSKISNIVIEGEDDKEEELIIKREMTYLNDLGEGKVYESRLLTEYTDIVDIEVI